MSRLMEWGRRRAHRDSAGAPLVDLVAGIAPNRVAQRHGLEPFQVDAIRSFYDELGVSQEVCDGTACHFAGGPALAARRGHPHAVRCLGHCYAAPAERDETLVRGGGLPWPPMPRRSLVTPARLLRNILAVHRDPATEYELPDGATILERVRAAGLRGRGGAAYPTAAKWKVAKETPAPDRVVVANGDEGDPGAYVDRLLLEEDPHAVLAGMVACARAIGARRGYVYVRAEYPRAQVAMERAIHEAASNGWTSNFEVTLVSGAGAYVVGEETALLRSLEGLRGEPQPKPPYPAQSGLFGLPTIVQNVETLAAVPWIVRANQRAHAKIFSLAGAVRHPGAVEASLGITLRALVEQGADGFEGAPKLAVVGGPMGRVVPATDFDVALDYDTLPGMGHGGVLVLDQTVSARALYQHFAEFAVAESCGTCTPCRVGTQQLLQLKGRAAVERLLETLEKGSLCGFGQGVPRPLRDLYQHFGAELEA